MKSKVFRTIKENKAREEFLRICHQNINLEKKKRFCGLMAESGESKFTIFSPFFQRVGGNGSKTLILLLTNRYKANIRAILNKPTLFPVLFNPLISGLIDYVA